MHIAYNHHLLKMHTAYHHRLLISLAMVGCVVLTLLIAVFFPTSSRPHANKSQTITYAEVWHQGQMIQSGQASVEGAEQSSVRVLDGIERAERINLQQMEQRQQEYERSVRERLGW